MSDIEKSLVFLHDNIPQWLKNIVDIEDKVACMQIEMAKVPVSRLAPTKRKTGSIESIRDLGALLEDRNTSSPAQQNLLACRKRKTPSILSGPASGPSKYRSRTMIIVYYDGQIQKSFETLVRAIGAGRNVLRKGKMTAKMEELANLAGSEDEEDQEEEERDQIISKIGHRHRAGLLLMRSQTVAMKTPHHGNSNNTSTPVAWFDSTDKALEQAQALCERAAHRSLREGDCQQELDGVRRYVNEAQAAATKEFAKYRGEGKLIKQELNIKSSVPTPIEEPKITAPDIPQLGRGTAPFPSKLVHIEVDEGDDDMDFVMPPIRLTSRV